ncbi:MAG: gliding motility-associated C-terminal domain-containing protein [Haliscomenobacter sp.]|nr:gliding motility-associated C-terminal domain-containing protein [Haliscomenobacter sp.]
MRDPPIQKRTNIRVNDLSVFPQAVPRFGGNAVSCSGARDGEAQLVIRGGIKPYRISWGTGDTTDLVRNLAAGTYPVTVTDAERCRIESAVRLSEPAPIQPSLETASAKCQGEESKLLVKNITGGTQPYLFSTDGQTFQTVRNLPFTLIGLAPGTYRFSLKDANTCVSETPFTLTEPSLSLVDLGPDRVIQSGDSVQLTATANFAAKRVVWSPAEVAPLAGDPLAASVRPLRTTTYRVELADTSGCVVSDELTIIVENQQRVFAPSAFSPNEDGQNDRFVLFSGPEVREIINLQIFNRWGALVYEAPIVQETGGWDGTFKGQAAPTGIYLFVAEIRLTNGDTQRISGDFLLMR